MVLDRDESSKEPMCCPFFIIWEELHGFAVGFVWIEGAGGLKCGGNGTEMARTVASEW